FNNQNFLVPVRDRIAWPELHAPERRIRARILALLPRSFEIRGNPAMRHFGNGSESELRLGFADPALARMKLSCHIEEGIARERISCAAKYRPRTMPRFSSGLFHGTPDAAQVT